MFKLTSTFSSDSSSDFLPERPPISRQTTDKLLSYYHQAGTDELDMQNKDTVEHSSHIRKPSIDSSLSTSSSEYSSDSSAGETSSPTKDVSTIRRRPSTNSATGGDRRRVAIVQMDTVAQSESGHGSAGATNLLSRRGHEGSLAGLALVAPPDASPANYSNFTPPTTAPITHDGVQPSISHESGHQRSSSEATGLRKNTSLRKNASLRRKPSRDVGIIGTLRATYESQQPKPAAPPSELQPPHFVIPQLRTPVPSPGTPPESYLTARLGAKPDNGASVSFGSRLGDNLPISTPAIGQEKEIGTRVAPPVLVALSSSEMQQLSTSASSSAPATNNAQPADAPPFTPSEPYSYLNYQPGVHSTAGPLPPPPRAAFRINPNTPPPPRPPRLQSPPPSRRRDATSPIPPSVTSVLASRTSSPTINVSNLPSQTDTQVQSPSDNKAESPTKSSASSPTNSSQIQSSQPVHIREGAFPPSTINQKPTMHFTSPVLESTPEKEPESVASSKTPSMEDLLSDVGHAMNTLGANTEEVTLTVMEPLYEESRPTLEHRDNSWVSFHIEDSPRSSVSGGRPLSSELKRSPSRSPQTSERSLERSTPSPPPKSFLNGFNLKRFSSLPRTPSRKSSSRASYSSRVSRTPSTSSVVIPPSSPPQSFCVLPPPVRKIRSRAPAAMFFSEIVSNRNTLERCAGYAQKINELYVHDCGLGDWVMDIKYGDTKQRKRTSVIDSPTSGHSFTPQPRHTSRSSVISDATFPMRPDASVATDLTSHRNEAAISVTPALPYPSLAPPPRSSSIHSSQQSLPSLVLALPPQITGKSGGFFSSLGRKTSINRSKSTGPSVVGSGPAKLLKLPPALPPRPININVAPSVPGGPRAPPGHRVQRSQTIMVTKPFAPDSPIRSPNSLGRRPSFHGGSLETALYSDPEFNRQVDKLSVLLPHAERDVLAGYLRRSGQDILAIGQYLEDEKRGTVIRD